MSRQKINIHATLARSVVNGPGERLIVFFQGCERDCPGCFNTELHPMEPHTLITARDILEGNGTTGLEGITVSGGEPFLQPAGLFELLRTAREDHELSTVVYTGFLIEELREDAEKNACLEHIDVLIDGAFVKESPEPSLLARGSTNQNFFFLSGRYKPEDFVMPGKVEITIDRDGIVTKTGFNRMPHKERSAA